MLHAIMHATSSGRDARMCGARLWRFYPSNQELIAGIIHGLLLAGWEWLQMISHHLQMAVTKRRNVLSLSTCWFHELLTSNICVQQHMVSCALPKVNLSRFLACSFYPSEPKTCNQRPVTVCNLSTQSDHQFCKQLKATPFHTANYLCAFVMNCKTWS